MIYRYVPLQDGWAHLHTLYALTHYSLYKNLLSINYKPYADWIGILSIYPFVRVLGYVEGLLMFFVILSIVLLLSARYFAYSITKDKFFSIVYACIAAVNVFVVKGFFAFTIGFIFFLFFVGKFIRENNIKTLIYLSFIEFFVHPFFFAESMLLIFWFWIYSVFSNDKNWIRFVYAFFILLILFMLGLESLNGGYIFGWAVPFSDRLKQLVKGAFLFPWYALWGKGLQFLLFFIPITVLMPIVFLVRTFKWQYFKSVEKNVILYTAATNYILYFVIFDVMKTGAFIHTRQMFIAFFIIIPLGWTLINRKKVKVIFDSYLLLTFFVEFFIVMNKFNWYEEKIKQANKELSKYVDKNTVFMAFTHIKDRDGFVYPLKHIGGLIGIERQALYFNNLDFLTSYQPLTISTDSINMESLYECKSTSTQFVETHVNSILVFTNNKRLKRRILQCYNKGFRIAFEDSNILVMRRRDTSKNKFPHY